MSPAAEPTTEVINDDSDAPEAEAAAAFDALFACRRPWLIGVRHHSPALAAAMPALLDVADPAIVAVELPTELEPWTAYLADPDAVAPLAISSATRLGDRLSFHPFADFSPELVAMRWAQRNGRRIAAIDLPVALRTPGALAGLDSSRRDTSDQAHPILTSLLAQADVDDLEELWDRMVEVHAVGASPEAVRRSGLGYGWAMRVDAATGGGVDPIDLVRERWMRLRLGELMAETTPTSEDTGGVAAIVGSFHAAALLENPLHWLDPGVELPRPESIDVPEPGQADPEGSVVTAMIPYNFEMLDSRSGYPAGIRDPMWQQRVVEAAGSTDAVEAAVSELSVAMTKALRSQDHTAGVPDSREAARVALDLARLRNLPAPGRRELVESLTLALAQGEPLGRGRAVARAAQRVLVGRYNGRRPAGAPRSGLSLAVEEELKDLGLPHEGAEKLADEKRLDPLRSARDRRRHLLLHRLRIAGVTYGSQIDGVGTGGVSTITQRWQLSWGPTAAATLEMAGLLGTTPTAAATGALRLRERQLREGDDWTPAQQLRALRQAIDAGLRGLATDYLAAAATEVLPRASMAELIQLHALSRIAAAGLSPGLVDDDGEADPIEVALAPDEILQFAVAQIEGLAGSEDLADAKAIIDLAHLHHNDLAGASSLRLASALRSFELNGHPLMAGAALAARIALEEVDPDDDLETPSVNDSVDIGSGEIGSGEIDNGEDGHVVEGDVSDHPDSTEDQAAGPTTELVDRISSWFDHANDDTAARLQGLLAAGEGPLANRSEVLLALTDRVRSWDDSDFIARLPALRHGFEGLPTAGRSRLVETIFRLLPAADNPDAANGGALALEHSPETLQGYAEADLTGRAAVVELLGQIPGAADAPANASTDDQASASKPPTTDGATAEADLAEQADPEPQRAAPAEPSQISIVDRWRLLLGRQGERMAPQAQRFGIALDNLYGRGHGEGSGPSALGRGEGRRGGSEEASPTARHWPDTLEELFGTKVREEVLGRAAARGRVDALLSLDPESVTPSVDLLQSILSLKGAMPEARLSHMRALVARIVEALTKELAVKIRPALTGLSTPRPTRRPTGSLDLRRTVNANLATVRADEDGNPTIVAEELIFRSKGQRSLDWHLTICVDVSGSMEASTIYAAITAAILAGVPALSVRFLTFSTEVIDMTDVVDDPLALLMEVSIGGGTDISKCVRFARGQLQVPSRSIVVVLSDFHEGGSTGRLVAEVRSLIDTGATVLGLAALNDRGAPDYHAATAQALVAAGMPVAALSPLELASWVGDVVRNNGSHASNAGSHR